MTIEAVEPSEEIEALAEVLHACVLGGAGVNFVIPFSIEEAGAFWRGISDRLVLVARIDRRIVGTVSLAPAPQPNQPHRADVAKLLVHPDARRRGVARALMQEVERRALAMGRTLLTLDTETGQAADSLYRDLGYRLIGVVPDYALAAGGNRKVAASFYFKQL